MFHQRISGWMMALRRRSEIRAAQRPGRATSSWPAFAGHDGTEQRACRGFDNFCASPNGGLIAAAGEGWNASRKARFQHRVSQGWHRVAQSRRYCASVTVHTPPLGSPQKKPKVCKFRGLCQPAPRPARGGCERLRASRRSLLAGESGGRHVPIRSAQLCASFENSVLKSCFLTLRRATPGAAVGCNDQRARRRDHLMRSPTTGHNNSR